MTLRERIAQQASYPHSLGLSCTAMGHGGSWRQGYERAIQDVLRLLDEAEEPAPHGATGDERALGETA